MAIMEMTGRERGLVAVALSAECETYLGRRILVEPQYGYGWTSHQGMEGASCPVPVPLDFHLVSGRFFMSHGKLMGGIGTIEELGHALHGLVVGFSARHTAERDFVRDPVTCNLTIGSLTHVSDNGWLLAVGAPALVGVGRLRDDAGARPTDDR
jgi:hypothetical protein